MGEQQAGRKRIGSKRHGIILGQVWGVKKVSGTESVNEEPEFS
jgi:hypothetical protein